jgi:uncharacterized metal-binding protein
MTHNPRKPVVFACAGSSPAGNLSWQVAKELERQGAAEMSCLAGIGARKPAFLRKLRDRQVWVIDGCPIHCGAGIFDLIDRLPDRHIRLADFGVKKQQPLEEPHAIAQSAQRILDDLRNHEETPATAVRGAGLSQP